MQNKPPSGTLCKVEPPDGPRLRVGETGPDDVRAWRRDRLAHCIGTLLRDPRVARSVAEGMRCRPDPQG